MSNQAIFCSYFNLDSVKEVHDDMFDHFIFNIPLNNFLIQISNDRRTVLQNWETNGKQYVLLNARGTKAGKEDILPNNTIYFISKDFLDEKKVSTLKRDLCGSTTIFKDTTLGRRNAQEKLELLSKLRTIFDIVKAPSLAELKNYTKHHNSLAYGTKKQNFEQLKKQLLALAETIPKDNLHFVKQVEKIINHDIATLNSTIEELDNCLKFFPSSDYDFKIWETFDNKKANKKIAQIDDLIHNPDMFVGNAMESITKYFINLQCEQLDQLSTHLSKIFKWRKDVQLTARYSAISPYWEEHHNFITAHYHFIEDALDEMKRRHNRYNEIKQSIDRENQQRKDALPRMFKKFENLSKESWATEFCDMLDEELTIMDFNPHTLSLTDSVISSTISTEPLFFQLPTSFSQPSTVTSSSLPSANSNLFQVYSALANSTVESVNPHENVACVPVATYSSLENSKKLMHNSAPNSTKEWEISMQQSRLVIQDMVISGNKAASASQIVISIAAFTRNRPQASAIKEVKELMILGNTELAKHNIQSITLSDPQVDDYVVFYSLSLVENIDTHLGAYYLLLTFPDCDYVHILQDDQLSSGVVLFKKFIVGKVVLIEDDVDNIFPSFGKPTRLVYIAL